MKWDKVGQEGDNSNRIGNSKRRFSNHKSFSSAASASADIKNVVLAYIGFDMFQNFIRRIPARYQKCFPTVSATFHFSLFSFTARSNLVYKCILLFSILSSCSRKVQEVEIY